MTATFDNRRLRLLVSVSILLALLFFLLNPSAALSTVDAEGWVQSSPLPRALDVAFVDSLTGWVVGLYGEIWKSTDGGTSWRRQDSGTTSDLEAVDFVDSQVGYAVGLAGILKTVDGGATWVEQSTAVTGTFADVDFADAMNGVVISKSGVVLSTKNGGTTWTAAPWPGELRDLVLVNAQTGWAVGPNEIYKTADGGVTWTAQISGVGWNLIGVDFVDSQNGWAVGVSGTVLRTADGGVTWTPCTPTTPGLAAVQFLDAQTGYVVNGVGPVLKTVNGGLSWTSTQLQPGLVALSFVDTETGWVISLVDKTIFKTSNGGTSWSATNSPAEAALVGVDFVDASTGWVVGQGTTVLATKNAGSTWVPQNTGASARLTGVAFVDSQTGWAVGEFGQIMKTANGGATWTAQNSDTYALFCDLAFRDRLTGWVLAYGGLTRTGDGGLTWSTSSFPIGRVGAKALSFADAKNGWVVGYDGKTLILNSKDGGATWTEQGAGLNDRLNAVDFVDSRVGWAVGDSGAILKTVDGGATWARQQSGQPYLPLLDVDFIDAQVGYVAAYGGKVLRTSDGGSTWITQTTITGSNLNSVDMVDARSGFIVGGYGTILITSDAGGRPLRFEETDSRLVLSGPWGSVAGTTSSGGSILRLDGSGSVTAHFSGSSLEVVAPRGPGFGKARMTLDTAAPVFVDLYSPSPLSQQGVLSFSGLTNEDHRLQIEWTGEKNPASAGIAIALDALDLIGNLEAAPTRPAFTDVPVTHPYCAAIQDMVAKGIVSGYTDDTFRPMNLVLRAQFAKMICGALGLTPVEGQLAPFSDLGANLPASLYPHEYIAVAYNNGITLGTGQGRFSPWLDIPRAQVITMVVRAAKNLEPGLLQTPPSGWTGTIGNFDPSHGQNLIWAEYNGLLAGLQGYGAGWNPWQKMTRGEVAQVLWNLMQK